MTAKYQQYLERNPDCVADLAYTLSQRRDYLPYRCFSITGNNSIGKISSMTKVPGTTPHLIMIFTGQGAHWYGMGKDLVENDAHFRNDIVAMDSILQGLKHPPTWSLLGKQITNRMHLTSILMTQMNLSSPQELTPSSGRRSHNQSAQQFKLRW